MQKLAILDWGIGGISIYKLVKEKYAVPVLYFSDTGTVPYGKMSRPELVARLKSVIAYLKSREVSHLVIGCNAASTVIPFIEFEAIEIEGVIDAAIEQTANLNPKRLGLIGGRRTVLSGVYTKGFAVRGIKLEQRIAQPLSALIESGDISSEKLKAEARRILKPLRNCSHILLACTHYPAASSILREMVSKDAVLVDPAAAVLKQMYKWKIDGTGQDSFVTTGNSEMMKRSAQLAFGVTIDNVSEIEL